MAEGNDPIDRRLVCRCGGSLRTHAVPGLRADL